MRQTFKPWIGSVDSVGLRPGSVQNDDVFWKLNWRDILKRQRVLPGINQADARQRGCAASQPTSFGCSEVMNGPARQSELKESHGAEGVKSFAWMLEDGDVGSIVDACHVLAKTH